MPLRPVGRTGEATIEQRYERVVVPLDRVRARVLPIGQRRELRPADRRLQVGHVRLVADLGHVVAPRSTGPVPAPSVPAHAVQARGSKPGRERLVVGGDGPALTDRQILRGVEAQTGRERCGARGCASDQTARSVRGVDDHAAAGQSGRVRERDVVDRVAAEIADDHRARRAGAPHRGSDGRRAGDQRVLVDVDEHGPISGVDDGGHRSAEGQARRQHRATGG